MINTESFYNLFLEDLNKEVLAFKDKRFSFQQVLIESISRSIFLKKQGITIGKRVLIDLDERKDFLFSFLACSLVGADVISVNENASTKELDNIIKISQPDLIWKTYSGSVNPEVELSSYNFTNINIVFFTSGTTSQPKGILHDFNGLINNAQAFNEATGLDGSVFMKHVFPIGYMAGLLNTFISPILAGGRVFFSEKFSPKSALSFWEEAIKEEVNTLWLAPTMLAILSSLDRGKYKDWTEKKIKNVFVGTAPLYLSVKNEFEKKFGVLCLESYGMTECMFISTNSRFKDATEGCTGRFLKGVKCKIIKDNQSSDKEKDLKGKIMISSDYMMKGYLEAVTKNNEYKLKPTSLWLDTGDQGHIIDEQLQISGRSKDLIIRGGVKISTKVIEDVLLSHNEIQQAAVLGRKHPVWGEEVVAFISLVDKSQINEERVLDFCKKRLSKESLPKKLIVMDDLPVSNTGKITKNKLKELLH